ncbi:MAG: hypothetical protein NT003_03220 [Candidatus Magasanikbacteria bacterium]|nr:hypothetical protein [Candidatus Magasanikbacteria bacterium]
MALLSPNMLELSQDTQAEIEDIAAYLSQVYGFDFPLDLLEDCYKQVREVLVVRSIADRVRQRISIDPDDFFDDEKMLRHLQRLERAFQFYVDEHLN